MLIHIYTHMYIRAYMYLCLVCDSGERENGERGRTGGEETEWLLPCAGRLKCAQRNRRAIGTAQLVPEVNSRRA